MLPVPPLPITHARITSDHYSNFYHRRLALAVLELHKNGIIQYVVYCIWFLSLSIIYETFIHIDLIGFFLTLWTTTGTILCIYILLKVLSQIIFMVTFKKILRCKIYTHFIYEKAEIKKLFPCGTYFSTNSQSLAVTVGTSWDNVLYVKVPGTSQVSHGS